VGIGITHPTETLHVAGFAQFDKVGAAGRIILNSVNRNDPGRVGLRFLNNQIISFEGDDLGDITWGFFSGWDWTRAHNAAIEIHGSSTTNWGRFLRLSHNGSNGLISTDAGNILIDPANGNGNVGIGVSDPVTKLEVGDIMRIRGDRWPATGRGMEFAFNPNLHQGYIQVYDRDAKEWGNLYLGNGNVGIGDLRPAEKLTVDGIIHTKSGGIKFPDGSVQTTAASAGTGGGIWKQTAVDVKLSAQFSDKASLTVTPPAPDGYFVLTFSGSCINTRKSTDVRIQVCLNNTPGSSQAYPGAAGFWQDTNGGHTRQTPLSTTRIFANADTTEKTFYLNAGDEFDGGYSLTGMFMVQWMPGSMQP
jgi:hypothetical protein